MAFAVVLSTEGMRLNGCPLSLHWWHVRVLVESRNVRLRPVFGAKLVVLGRAGQRKAWDACLCRNADAGLDGGQTIADARIVARRVESQVR